MRIVAAAKFGDDRTIDDDARKRIGHDAFQAIADLDAHLSVIGRNHQQYAVIFLFLAQRPGPEKAVGIGFNVLAIEAWHCHHHQLIGGFRFKIRKFLYKLLALRGIDDTRSIHHAARQRQRWFRSLLRQRALKGTKGGKQHNHGRKQPLRPFPATRTVLPDPNTRHENADQLKLTLGAAWLPASALKVGMGCASRYQIHVQIIVGMVRSDVL